MDVHKLILSKAKNKFYADRYYKFIISCRNKNTDKIPHVQSHHICPKANDLFPEYKNFSIYVWNKIKLTHRQHFIAHWMLWKAYGGSQTYAFYAMNHQINRRTGIQIKNSKIYQKVKSESANQIRLNNTGKSGYIDKDGNRFQCSVNDPRVLSGEIISLSKGRKFKPRSAESRLKTSLANKGKIHRKMTIDERISRRKNIIKELYYDTPNKNFIEMDPLLATSQYIKVFTNGQTVWNQKGEFRRISKKIPIPPPGWFFSDPNIIYQAINLDTNMYIETVYDGLPERYHKFGLRKSGMKLLYCVTLQKDIYIDGEPIVY
jgi:hypothetical protein